MKYSGKDLRVSIKVAGEYVQLPGERSSAGAFTNEQVDTTTKDDAPWRALTAVGTRFTEITASGVMRDGVDKATWNALMVAIFNGTQLEVRLDSAFGLVAEGLAMVPSLERAGEYNGAETYTVSFSSSGVVSTYTPPVPPQTCVNPAVAYADTQLAYHVKGWNTGSGGVELIGTILHVSGTRFEGTVTAQDLGGDGLPWGAPYTATVHVDIICQVVDGIAYYDIVDDWGNRTQVIWQGLKYQPPEWSSPPYTCPVEYSALVDHYSGTYTGGPFQIDATLVDNSFSCDAWVATPYINWYSEYHALITPAPSSLVNPADWFGYWDTTTAAATQLVTSTGVGAFDHYGARPPASFDVVEAALKFDPVSGTEWMGCVGVASETLTKLTMGMKVKNLEPSAALAILEVGPAFDSVEVALSGNTVATYFTTVTSPSGNESFPDPAILTDNNWHWVIMTVDFATKAVNLYVDGALYSTLTSAYAHASISVGSAFIHCWNNQKSLIKAVFVVKDVISSEALAALAAGHLPNSAGILT